MSAGQTALWRHVLLWSAMSIVLATVVTFSAPAPLSAHAIGTGDLYAGDPIVNEHDLTSSDPVLRNNACGVASATMMLDYHLLQSDPLHKPLSMASVQTFVPVSHTGTTGPDMQN